MTLKARLQDSPYQGYTYSYPHKTAYRPLQTPVSLRQAWSEEERKSLFLYLHIPFCEMRCGFCNLFTTARPQDSLPARYLKQLRVESEAVRDALGEAEFARLAVGACSGRGRPHQRADLRVARPVAPGLPPMGLCRAVGHHRPCLAPAMLCPTAG